MAERLAQLAEGGRVGGVSSSLEEEGVMTRGLTWWVRLAGERIWVTDGSGLACSLCFAVGGSKSGLGVVFLLGTIAGGPDEGSEQVSIGRNRWWKSVHSTRSIELSKTWSGSQTKSVEC
jgi:hypothetical protein